MCKFARGAQVHGQCFQLDAILFHVTRKNIDLETATGVERDFVNELNRLCIKRTGDAENQTTKSANVAVVQANR